MSWFAGFGAAVSIKLSSSIDDVVWLAPFLTSNQSQTARMQNAAIYIGVCLTQTVVAMAIAYSGDTVVGLVTRNSDKAWSTDKILTVFAGSIMAIYSVKLAYDYYQEMNEEGDGDSQGSNYDEASLEDGGEMKPEKVPLSAREEDPHEVQPQKSSKSCDARKGNDRSQTLFVIAFLGSVDDLTLFVPMLVGKGFDVVQLVLGGFVAASAIVTLCIFLGLCKPVADCLSKIPLAAIVISFATALLIKGLMME
mmetsp:Transcript_143137/g.457429  ORF Transcript_143137/g.457429 Transcript_143137/m.457429 type:complete len:251 (+) Transcript_143137:108-860(+)